jgi:Zn-dependent protease with chaperone function
MPIHSPLPATRLALLLVLAAPFSTLDAQVTIKRSPSGFNLFSIEQEVELGQRSATEVEQQLPMLNDATVDRFLEGIITRLAAQAPGAKFPYEIDAVNSAEINAFALPGGPMYVNRGLVTTVRNEAELAGVLAHEMSHVVLRHGTEQASKAYLGQAGLGLLGGLIGRGNTAADIVNAIGGFGLNAVFLKFSRSDELEADALGAEIMARAGYDPAAMATMFALLRSEQGRDPSKLEEFFSSHPSPADRESRIRTIASQLGGGGAQQVVGNLATIQSRMQGLSVAQATEPTWRTSPGTVVQPSTWPVAISIPAPSNVFARFAHDSGYYQIEYPNNWVAYPSGFAVTLSPDSGVVQSGTAPPQLVYGVIVNHYVPFDDPDDRWQNSLQRNYAPFEDRNQPRGFLEDATDDLVRTILDANAYLSAAVGSAQQLVIDGARGWSVLLRGPSPVTGQEERVTVYTRALPDDHVIYAICVAPTAAASVVEPACSRMVRTLRVNDASAHRHPGF